MYDVRPTDRVYQGMTISFDFSIEEIWPTLTAGATLVAGPNDSRRLGAELAEFLDEAAVTVLYCVPTLLATIPRDLPRVRSLLVGGEACPGRHRRAVEQAGAPNAEHLRPHRVHGHRDLGRAASRSARHHRAAAADLFGRRAGRAIATPVR